MGWLKALGIILIFVVIIFLIIYWFVPYNEIDFNLEPTNSNFSLTNYSKMQFYDNMRYPSNKISYKIYDACTLQKKSDMEQTLEILENLTILEFYPVLSGEEISITCTDEVVYEGSMFVGGEGGVTNVTVAGDFHVIFNGKVLLIRNSECQTPNIAIHELLHALGFAHSENKNNIMYAISNCRQTIGEDIPKFLDEIYSVEPKPDLVFENASIELKGKYLDANFSVRNNGLKYSPNAKIIVYADDKNVKEIELAPLDIGYGRKIFLSNIWVTKINIDSIKFVIETDFEELDKTNNEIVFS